MPDPTQPAKKSSGFLAGFIMPLLSCRLAAQKSSRCEPNTLRSKVFGAFDLTRGGRLPPRAPPHTRKDVQIVVLFDIQCKKRQFKVNCRFLL